MEFYTTASWTLPGGTGGSYAGQRRGSAIGVQRPGVFRRMAPPDGPDRARRGVPGNRLALERPPSLTVPDGYWTGGQDLFKDLFEDEDCRGEELFAVSQVRPPNTGAPAAKGKKRRGRR